MLEPFDSYSAALIFYKNIPFFIPTNCTLPITRLNVYTPRVDSRKRSVIVYFHGGAYIMGGGSSMFFRPSHILEQDVVVVTFNYRFTLDEVYNSWSICI